MTYGGDSDAHLVDAIDGGAAPTLEHMDDDGAADGAPTKKGAVRRNPWGPMSYADLITKAIQSSPDSKLTLSEIYDWFCKNVPYFSDKADTNSSAGWKVG